MKCVVMITKLLFLSGVFGKSDIVGVPEGILSFSGLESCF